MKISIRTKLIAAISGLIVVLFSIASYLFVTEKRVELAEDIYRNSLAFSRLSSGFVAHFHDIFLTQGSFLYFNREMQNLFRQNPDIGAVAIANYSGDLLYDSTLDKEKTYEGERRAVQGEDLVTQIRSEHISFTTQDGRIFYVKDDGTFIDRDEKTIPRPAEGTLLRHIVVPATETLTVIYKLDYTNLEKRIARIKERIVYLALFGVLLGLFMSLFMSAQLTRPVKELVKAARKIAKSDFTARVQIKTHDEMKYLGDAFNQMAKDLGASVEARVYKERVGRELELAGEIQKTLLPKKLPPVPGLDLSAGLIPAEEIGGDIYDFLPLDEKRILMYLGDVTGHGVPAGIISSVANALLFGYTDTNDLAQILLRVNRVLKAKIMPNMFMTLCLMYWDAETSLFRYANAGHEQIVHYKAAEKRAEYLQSRGIALGMIPDISKQTQQFDVSLAADDVLLVYSDGIPEAWRNEKEKYGKEKLLQTMERIGNLPRADAIKEALFADVKEYAAGYKQMDDMTIIVIKRM